MLLDLLKEQYLTMSLDNVINVFQIIDNHLDFLYNVRTHGDATKMQTLTNIHFLLEQNLKSLQFTFNNNAEYQATIACLQYSLGELKNMIYGLNNVEKVQLCAIGWNSNFEEYIRQCRSAIAAFIQKFGDSRADFNDKSSKRQRV
jgi:hypothetical protein